MAAKRRIKRVGYRTGWTTHAAIMLVVTRKDGRSLGVYVAPTPGLLDNWVVMLLDTDAAAEGPEAVFEDHGHKSLAPVWGLHNALKTAERVAKRWQRASGPAAKIEDCDCEEMPLRSKPVRRLPAGRRPAS